MTAYCADYTLTVGCSNEQPTQWRQYSRHLNQALNRVLYVFDDVVVEDHVEVPVGKGQAAHVGGRDRIGALGDGRRHVGVAPVMSTAILSRF